MNKIRYHLRWGVIFAALLIILSACAGEDPVTQFPTPTANLFPVLPPTQTQSPFQGILPSPTPDLLQNLFPTPSPTADVATSVVIVPAASATPETQVIFVTPTSGSLLPVTGADLTATPPENTGWIWKASLVVVGVSLMALGLMMGRKR